MSGARFDQKKVMTTVSLQTSAGARSATHAPVVLVVGNPNAGKTTLFNALTGLRAKTANFPGTTVERREARIALGDKPINLIDLPGLYSLTPASTEERIARDALLGLTPGLPGPAAVIAIVDATNVERNLFLVSQVIELGIPTVIALSMSDVAERRGVRIDVDALSRELAAPVVPVVATTGRGISTLCDALSSQLAEPVADRPLPVGLKCEAGQCPFDRRFAWSEAIGRKCVVAPPTAVGRRSDRIDAVLTHPIAGLLIFAGVMFGVFYLIFGLASVPMELIDVLFGRLGGWLASVLPAGALTSLLVEGVIAGVGGVLVFLPQICVLFLLIALLEDTGYLARAAFVMDKLMRRVGLPGKAFVPMLSAHACAIPAIMSTRVIENRRDRLVTILVLPLMTCSARLPVYAMVTALLFPSQPLKGALAFAGAYALGILAALTMAFVFKRTILPGESRPLVIELPSYKVPNLRNALLTVADRATVFVKNAGTVILAISVILWWLANYPRPNVPPTDSTANVTAVDELPDAEVDEVGDRQRLANSFAGRFGHAIEPVIRPLGFDWRIGVGIISSFAAREVLVSSLAIIYGAEDEPVGDVRSAVLDRMRDARRPDGSPVFTTATCLSLLVFYVLAMQCLPTQAITRRETGSWKWAGLQLAYMTVLAYGASLVTYQGLTALGIN